MPLTFIPIYGIAQEWITSNDKINKRIWVINDKTCMNINI